jgi:hypothetical protein
MRGDAANLNIPRSARNEEMLAESTYDFVRFAEFDS